MASTLLAMLLALTACSGEDGAPANGSSSGQSPPAAAVPQATPVGTATGAPVTKAIGSEGGELVSEDGVLTLVVPASALSAETELGIQPITNNCFASIGGAYRLTPDGATFAKPVELHFAYADADLTGTVSGALGIAFQDKDGFWEWQDGAAADATKKEVVLPTKHFTDYSMLQGFQIRADKDRVKLGEAVTVRVLNCVAAASMSGKLPNFVYPCTDQPDSQLTWLGGRADETTWAVNGAPGGTGGDGLVTNGTDAQATYTAPGSKPSSNPVAVSVKTKVKGELLVANITVGDPSGSWKGTLKHTWHQKGLGVEVTSELAADVSLDQVPHEIPNPIVTQFRPVGTFDFISTVVDPECTVTNRGQGTLNQGATQGSLELMNVTNGFALRIFTGDFERVVTTVCRKGKIDPTTFVDHQTIVQVELRQNFTVSMDGKSIKGEADTLDNFGNSNGGQGKFEWDLVLSE